MLAWAGSASSALLGTRHLSLGPEPVLLGPPLRPAFLLPKHVRALLDAFVGFVIVAVLSCSSLDSCKGIS